MAKRRDWKIWLWPILLLLALAAGTLADFPANSWAGRLMNIKNMDKVAHAGYIGLLCALLARRWSILSVILVGVGVSVGIEIAQAALSEHRSPDVMDALAGIFGSWVGWSLYQIKFIKNIFETKLG